jgi:hypothetical protein
MAASGQTRKIRACPLHVCFTPEPGRFGAPAEPSEKGHQRKDSFLSATHAEARARE